MKGIQGTSNKTYRQIMGNGLRYEIPKFQRDYTWEAEQWDDLWQDVKLLLSSDEEEHYMGYLVLQTTNNKNFTIIDGQQRLTTMSLLILAVLKCIDDLEKMGVDADNNRVRRENLLNSYIGYLNPVTLIANNKLKLNRNSDDYYRQHLVLLKDLPIRNTNASEKHMRECFLWYYERLKKDFKTGEQLAGFIDSIVDKLFFTVIEVTDQINAFKIFETLNARGVQLSAADLLKNYLFSIVDETRPHVSEIEELELIWSKIVGKLGEQKFEDYIRYYWNSYNKSVGKKDLFKTLKKNITQKEHVFRLIRDLNDAADLYLAIHDPNDDLWKMYPEIRSSLYELKLFQIKQTNSLLIAGYKNLDINQFQSLVRICSIISFRYNVIGGLNPNAQEEVYNSIAIAVGKNRRFEVSSFQPIYVSDNNFVNDFSSKLFKNTNRNHKIIKYIYSKLEQYIHKNEIDSDSDLYTVEHILPESADENWGGFSQEEINRSVYRLGNLTLLEKKLNKDADVAEYAGKVKIFEQSKSFLTRDIADAYKTWTEDTISSRQSKLAKDAKAVWRIQGLM